MAPHPVQAAPTQARRWVPRNATYKGAEEKMQLENLQNDKVLLLHSTLQHLSKDSPWGCCAAPKAKEKDSICCSLFFQTVHMPLKAPEAVSTSPTLMGHSKAFLKVYKTLRWVSSSRSQLCQFPMFLLSPLPITFNNGKGSPNTTFLCFSLHHLHLPATGWLLRMLSLRATLLKSNKVLLFFIWFPWHQRQFCFSAL